jgi:HlyD family secretion protein
MSIIFTRITFWLALASLTGLVFFVQANSAVAPMPQPLSPPPEKPFPLGIGASGIIESLHENTSVGVPFAGLVKEVKVQVWKQVKLGEELFRLDDRDLLALLTTEQAELAMREAEMRRAERQYERLAKIGVGAAVAQEDLEKREDDLTVAKAAVAKAQASIQSRHQLLDRCIIRAPISGTILQVNLRAGEYATPGASTAPMVLGSIHDLQIRADVDEQLAPRVRSEAKAVAYRKGETTRPLTLNFLRIEPYIVPKKSLTGSSTERVDTRVLQVIFTFTNDETLKTYVGQQVDVFIEE